MMHAIKMSVLFRTTFIPTGASYVGIHETTDLSFGTEQYRDPYIGEGVKLIALAKAHNNNRRLFRVDVIQVGTRKDVESRLKSITETLNFNDPKTLNGVDGWPVGRKLTEEHKANVSKGMETAAIGNTNAMKIDIDAPANTKLKWFNNGTEAKMLLCDAEDRPIKKEYADWVLGKVHKNAYVQSRLLALKKEQNASSPVTGEEESENDSEEDE